MDMMQNSNIFNNTEIVLEMQIIACFAAIILSDLFNDFRVSSGSINEKMKNKNYVILYLILHLVSYIVHFFRIHDVKLNGKPDINGVYYARRETFISNIETFVICIVIGFTVKDLFDMGPQAFHNEGFLSYLLLMDSIVTFFYKAFIYIGLVVKLDGEIKKNLFTLYFK